MYSLSIFSFPHSQALTTTTLFFVWIRLFLDYTCKWNHAALLFLFSQSAVCWFDPLTYSNVITNRFNTSHMTHKYNFLYFLWQEYSQDSTLGTLETGTALQSVITVLCIWSAWLIYLLVAHLYPLTSPRFLHPDT